MTERPIFVSTPDKPELVKEVFLPMEWHGGFAAVQKEKNIKALHKAAEIVGYRNVLEVSTNSENRRGRHLSAFHLKVENERLGEIPLECAFQGSKIFERGGPFVDLYRTDVRRAKKDMRLKESGRLIGFSFDGFDFPLEPKTVFYDWLYVNCIYPHRQWATKLLGYGGFSDIEFNPHRSINCQARSIALFLSLLKLNLLEEAVKSPSGFVSLLLRFSYRPQLRLKEDAQPVFFSDSR